METLNLQKKWEEERAKIKAKLKRFTKAPLKVTGLHIDPKTMASDFEKHTSADGRPPLKGAKDD